VNVAAPSDVDALVEHLFRHSAGQMVSRLARWLGSARLDLAEEAVQDALVRALQAWPFAGVPAEPRAWLFQVARHRALDLIRRDVALRGKLDILERETPEAEVREQALGDDELAMMFMCCHPSLPHAGRVALTLKTVGGFGVGEIAAAFLAEPDAIAQRLVRAKRQIREQEIAVEIPLPGELGARLESVLDVLYLFFNEGYAAHGGENLVRADLCGEAIRLTGILARNAATDLPAVHALLALMLLQASRLPARVDDAGDLLLLSEQDRARWDQELIAEGLDHLERASSGNEVTPYHAEAAIAAVHAVAHDQASIDWPHIVRLYDDLLALKPSPVVELNRAIALAMVEGPAAGIAAIERFEADPVLARYYLLPAALGGLWVKQGDFTRAAQHYREALTRSCSAPERRFLEKQLARCGGASLERHT
jgi:RNA polymerase sigma-70 factor (ECF subfamily)